MHITVLRNILDEVNLSLELAAGGFAGGVAKTFVAPLERTKILFQTGKVQKMGIASTLALLYKTEGLPGLFRGNSASVLRIVPYAAIHFSAYEYYRRYYLRIFANTPDTDSSRGRSRGSSSAGSSSAGSNSLDQGSPSHDDGRPASSGSNDSSPHPVSNSTSRGSTKDGSGTASILAADQPSFTPAPAPMPPALPPSLVIPSLTPPPGLPAQVNPLWDLLAGSSAGATAVMMTYPLDLVRTRLAWSTAGLQPAPVTITPHTTTTAAVPTAAHAASAKARASSSNMSGVPHSAQPSVSATLHATSHASPAIAARANIRSVLMHTVTEEGFLGLYRGVGPTLLGILPYAGIKFYVYSSFKNWYKRGQHKKDANRTVNSSSAVAAGQPPVQPRLPLEVTLCFGALSGLLAQTLTYPLDILRRRMQIQGMAGPAAGAAGVSECAPTQGMWQTFRGILAENGWRGVFRGLSLNYVKVVPSTAIGFALYDTMKEFLDLHGNL